MNVLAFHLVAAKEALLALDCGEANALLSFSAVRRTIERAVLGTIIGTTAAGPHSTLAQDEFEERLQCRNT